MSLTVLAAVLQQRLLVLTDNELVAADASGLLPLPHLLRLVKLIKAVCFHGCQTFASQLERESERPAPAPRADGGAIADVPFGRFVFHTLSRLLRRLFDRCVWRGWLAGWLAAWLASNKCTA